MKIKDVNVSEVIGDELPHRVEIVRDDSGATVVYGAAIDLSSALLVAINMLLDEATSKPLLGNATCAELLKEISVRIDVCGPGLDYKTVGPHDEVEDIGRK